MVSNVEAIESGGSLTHYNMIGKKRPAPEVKGGYYLFEGWVMADIQLDIDKTITGQKINFDIQDGEIEIPYGDDVRILDRTKVKSFTVNNRKFINTRYIDEPATKNIFFEVLEEGSIKVYCQYYSDLRPPTYVPGLAVGDQNYKIVVKKNYFIKTNSSLKNFNNDRKRNLAYFKNNAQTVAYIRQGKLRLNKIDDFVKAARFYNKSHLNEVLK